MKLHQPEQAMSAFERAVSLDPRNGRAGTASAFARRQAEQNEVGIVGVRSIAQADAPADADIPFAKATLVTLHRTAAEARDAAERVLKINPNYPQAAELLRALQTRPNK